MTKGGLPATAIRSGRSGSGVKPTVSSPEEAGAAAVFRRDAGVGRHERVFHRRILRADRGGGPERSENESE